MLFREIIEFSFFSDQTFSIIKQMTDLSNQATKLPKFVYYNIRGFGQPIRNLLYYMEVDFQNVEIQREYSDQLQSTFNSGLPKFEDEQITMSDSVAIPIYLCQKYHQQVLIGYTPRAKAKINEIMFKYWMEKTKMISKILNIVRGFFQANEDKQKWVRIELEKMTRQSKFISYCLKMHHQTKKWVNQCLTIIDFFFYEICFYVNGFFKKEIEKDQYLNGFINFCCLFESLQFFKKKKKQIKNVKLFPEFKEEKYAKIICSLWKGQSKPFNF